MRVILFLISQLILVRALLIIELLKSKSKADFVLLRDSMNFVNHEYVSLRNKLKAEHIKKRIKNGRDRQQYTKLNSFKKLPIEIMNEMYRYDAFFKGDFENFIKFSEIQVKLKREQFLNSSMYKAGMVLLSPDFFGAFGHLALGIDYLRMARQLDLFQNIKFFRMNHNNKNQALMQYYDDYSSVIPIGTRYDEMLIHKSFGSSIFDLDYMHLPNKSLNGSQVYNFLSNELSNLKLETKYLELRYEELRHLEIFRSFFGMSSSDWFVVLHVREDHNIHFSASNASIEDYEKAANIIVQNGGWVVRIGETGVKNIAWGDRVIDYANSKLKNSSTDIALLASCKFMIGTSSGPCSVPPIFGVPILYTNAPALAFSYRQRGLFIPQMLFHKDLNRVLSPEESMVEPAAWTTQVIQSSDVIRLPNSPDQLAEGVVEMLEQEWSREQALTQDQIRFMRTVDVADGYAGAIPTLSYLRRISQLS